jgi:hypothetical protein
MNIRMGVAEALGDELRAIVSVLKNDIERLEPSEKWVELVEQFRIVFQNSERAIETLKEIRPMVHL